MAGRTHGPSRETFGDSHELSELSDHSRSEHRAECNIASENGNGTRKDSQSSESLEPMTSNFFCCTTIIVLLLDTF